ncbi:uncharacterized protein LOC123007630 [Tribolium madens]|uniref:uncharacterized protein LOC123007630 n=1 Tax=Tribolium madens TaxID=41895 RepID=UPI001CF739EA|nr:uncharacterized protein LOC123007630 [Tribolium madens]
MQTFQFGLLFLTCVFARKGFGPTEQEWGFVQVRAGAKMFWWLHQTSANVSSYTDRPLVIWLQGGPGSSSTGYGNFAELGPLDADLNPRNTSWINEYNVLFVDNPVGTGYSHVDNPKYFATTNVQIASDFVVLLKGFYEAVPDLKNTPFYIFSESYGGKMTTEIALEIDAAIKSGSLDANLIGIGFGDSWISPIDSILSWGPYLLSVGAIDQNQYELLQETAEEAKKAIENGKYSEATDLFNQAQMIIQITTANIDVYNILTKVSSDWNFKKNLIMPVNDDVDDKISVLMNNQVKEALGLDVNWGDQSVGVSDALHEDITKPVVETVGSILNTTNIQVAVYNGQLDLIVDTPGQMQWLNNLKFSGLEEWKTAERKTIGVNDIVEGYYKKVGNLAMYWVDRAGHMVPRDNPAAMNFILQDMTNGSWYFSTQYILSLIKNSNIFSRIPPKMKSLILVFFTIAATLARKGFGPTNQEWGFVEVREGAHMFWWLHKTAASVDKYTEKPLLIWLQGGPGASSTGDGSFNELGPLDADLNPRNTTWVNDYNVLFVDNPVGTGYSYVDDSKYFATNNSQIANDFVALLKRFYEIVPDLKQTPLHIFSESYGGKMTAEIGLQIYLATKSGDLECNLVSVGLGDPWISPIDSVLSWGPYLLNVGAVDQNEYEKVQAKAEETKAAIEAGKYAEATDLWGQAEQVIGTVTGGIDFYNILKKSEEVVLNSSNDVDIKIATLMKNDVKKALGLDVDWGYQSRAVFDALHEDFMKPVTDIVERLLNETDVHVAVYNGQLDLIVPTPGTIKWVDKLKFPGLDQWKIASKLAMIVDKIVEGYYKKVGNLAMYWVNRAGHMVPKDNPAAMNFILQDMTRRSYREEI